MHAVVGHVACLAGGCLHDEQIERAAPIQRFWVLSNSTSLVLGFYMGISMRAVIGFSAEQRQWRYSASS